MVARCAKLLSCELEELQFALARHLLDLPGLQPTGKERALFKGERVAREVIWLQVDHPLEVFLPLVRCLAGRAED